MSNDAVQNNEILTYTTEMDLKYIFLCERKTQKATYCMTAYLTQGLGNRKRHERIWEGDVTVYGSAFGYYDSGH
jgi:hypothetical protein